MYSVDSSSNFAIIETLTCTESQDLRYLTREDIENDFFGKIDNERYEYFQNGHSTHNSTYVNNNNYYNEYDDDNLSDARDSYSNESSGENEYEDISSNIIQSSLFEPTSTENTLTLPRNQHINTSSEFSLSNNIAEFLDIGLWANMLSKDTVINILNFLFFTIMSLIGVIFELGSYFILPFYGVMCYFVINGLCCVKRDLSLINKHLRWKRKVNKAPLTLRKWLESRGVPNPTKSEQVNGFIMAMGPPGLNAKSIKPEGMASYRSKTRKIKINAQPSKPCKNEVKVNLIGDRAHVPISFAGDSLSKVALIDMGASSCCVSPGILQEIEQFICVPRVPYKYNMGGVFPNHVERYEDYVLLTFKVGPELELRNIPFIVTENTSGIILGMNVLRAFRFSQYWKGDDLYFKFSNNNSISSSVKAIFLPTSRLSASTVAEVIVEPGEIIPVELNIPCLKGIKNSNLNKTPVYLTTSQDLVDNSSQGLEVLPCITTIKKNTVNGLIKNTSDVPLKVPENICIAEITEIGKHDLTDAVSASDLIKTKQLFEKIPRLYENVCYCDYKSKGHVIQFCDQRGSTYTRFNMVSNEISKPLNFYETGPAHTKPLNFQREGINVLKQGRDGLDTAEIYLIPNGNCEFDEITKSEIEHMYDGIRTSEKPFYILMPYMQRATISVMRMCVL